MKKIIAALVIGILLISCTPEGQIYNEHQDLSPEMTWKKKDSRKFEVAVEDISTNYEMSLSFRYAEGFPQKVMKVQVTETSPSGEIAEFEYDLKVREDNGDYIGEGSLDIWDSEHVVEKAKKYEEKGTYTYVIKHNMPQDPVQLVMEIGVILNKSK